MKMNYKNIIAAAILSVGSSVSPLASAASCGTGKIVEIMEGGWGADDFAIRIDYSTSANSHTGTLKAAGPDNYNVFNISHLSASGVDAIRRAAYLAYGTNTTIRIWSHTGLCSNATQIQLLP